MHRGPLSGWLRLLRACLSLLHMVSPPPGPAWAWAHGAWAGSRRGRAQASGPLPIALATGNHRSVQVQGLGKQTPPFTGQRCNVTWQKSCLWIWGHVYHLQVRWSHYGKHADQMQRQEEEGCSKSGFCQAALMKVVRVEVSLLHSNERAKRSSILHDWLLEPAPALLNLHVFTFHQSETASALMNSICLNSCRTREENWESVSSSLSDWSAGTGRAKSQEAVPGAYGSFLSSSRVCARSVLEKWEGQAVITSAFCP